MPIWICIIVVALAACDAGGASSVNAERSRASSERAVDQLDEIRWKFVTDGALTASAAATGTHVYFGGADGVLRAVDPKTGDELWATSLGAPIHGTPTVLKNRVLVGTDSGLSAVSHEGTVEWAFDTGAPVDVQATVVDSVAYFGDRLGAIWAVDAVGGAEIWSAKTAGAILAPLAAAGGVLVAGSSDGRVYRLDPAKGEAVWSWMSSAPVRGVAIEGTMVVVTSASRTVALSAESGEEQWQFDVGGTVATPPTLHSGTLIVGTGQGDIVTLSASDGKLQRRKQVDAPVSGPVTVAGGHAFVPTSNGLVVLDSKGDVAWTFRTDGPVVSAVTPRDGVLYVTDVAGSLYALR